MDIFTKWLCYDGLVGVTESGEYYEINTGAIMNREVHAGAIYYRAFSSSKRYSWRKCNLTKIEKRLQIIQIPF